jgi:hypothetical protein
LFGRLAEVEQTPLRARWQHGAAGSRQNHFQEARPGLLFAASLKRSNTSVATADKKSRLKRSARLSP